MGDLASRARAVRTAYAEAGNTVTVRAGARFVLNRRCPQVWDANHVGAVGESGVVDLSELRSAIDEVFDWASHRQVRLGPQSPPALAASLVVDGYELHSEVVSVLPSSVGIGVGGPVAGLEIRAVDGDDDEASLVALHRADHAEEAVAEHREPWPASLTEQIVEARLAKAPSLRFFLAAVEGVDVGFLSSFVPGAAWVSAAAGMGMVEDLFTLPGHRGSGVARALVGHCVTDARRRGATEVAIGADPADWPKRWYVRLGFVPTLVTTTATRSG